MKLTPELIEQAHSYLSPLKDRELDLRGLKIPAIDNLGVTRDQHDSIDLTDNDIRSLTNLPSLPRLTTLILSNNAIASIAPRIANAAPRLTTLVLTNNRIESLAALQPLARFPCLEYLSLLGNGVARKEHYREWVISRCPKVRVLDFRRVKEKERALAKSLMELPDGRPSALAASIAAEGGPAVPDEGASAKTFDVGSTKGAAGRLMTAEERKALEEAIERSSSLEEIRNLEERLKLGYTVPAAKKDEEMQS
ncbi:L domain-like protein [Tilletiopsis washingtonensis]|uniref:U2 small nuclear ribonucleoprotein A' n=1 Tax=Tilletiopsis washingtonensis TaxID=58919 RepID=A0A316Z2V3_9BASI|nr:L domain-like protein [Tilletiopsis washingtonensis]PWN96110.1 L domain-like protein [Tilletiopsis washingtonensis]